jgi:hypothetical protein
VSSRPRRAGQAFRRAEQGVKTARTEPLRQQQPRHLHLLLSLCRLSEPRRLPDVRSSSMPPLVARNGNTLGSPPLLAVSAALRASECCTHCVMRSAAGGGGGGRKRAEGRRSRLAPPSASREGKSERARNKPDLACALMEGERASLTLAGPPQPQPQRSSQSSLEAKRRRGAAARLGRPAPTLHMRPERSTLALPCAAPRPTSRESRES